MKMFSSLVTSTQSLMDYIMEDFCLNCHLPNITKEPTCFKNHTHPSCIDLILANFPKSFQNYMAVETGLFDFHKMTLTIMKSHYKKLKHNIITYRKYTNFPSDLYREKVTENIFKKTRIPKYYF